MHGQGAADSHVRPVLEQLEPRLLLDGAGEELAVELFSVSPALFVENQGQWADESVHYAFQGDGANVLFTDAGPIFQVFKREATDEAAAADTPPAYDPLAPDLPGEQDYITQSVQFSVHFDGANAASPVGLGQAETYFNYFIGDQADWRSNVPAYETVAYEGLYDGIDLHTWGRRDSLKYEFHVAPGADYGEIQVSYEGIDGLFIDAEGALHVQTALGELIDDAPYIYQLIDGEQVEVAGAFELVDGDTYAFDITAAYDSTRELVIDPYLSWSTYLGGSDYDRGYGVAVDATGGVYVTGQTESAGWASGGSDTSHNGGQDAFVARLSSVGGHLWSTYLGGSGSDLGFGVAADGSGGVYVTGSTTSAGWVSGGFDTSHNGGQDAFVARLSSAGGHLWSTYLGGSDGDIGRGVAGDGAGGVYVTGSTTSAGWVSGGFDTTHNGIGDAFVARIRPIMGDANGDDIVDGLDYVIWSNNYEPFVGGKTWEQGDLNGDGIVDGLDYIVWSNNYDPVVPAVASPGMVGDAAEREVAATAAAQLLESGLVGEAGQGAIRRSLTLPASLATIGPGVSASLGGWAGHSAGAPSESDLSGGKEDGRDVPAWPVNRLRAAAPAGVPEEVEQVLLTDTGAAGMRGPSHGLAALEDDLVDILGLVQLKAPLHA